MPRIITIEQTDEEKATNETPAWLLAYQRHTKTRWYKRIRPKQFFFYLIVSAVAGGAAVLLFQYMDWSFFNPFGLNLFGGFGG